MGHIETPCTIILVVLCSLVVYEHVIAISAILLIYILYNVLRNTEMLDIGAKAVLVTGCDTGFGFHLAKRLEERGFIVFAGVLDDKGEGAKTLLSKKSDRLHVVKLDVTQDDDVRQAFQYVQDYSKGLWAIVNNAGILLPGDIELVTIKQYQRCVDINLFGMIRVIKTFLPLIRKSKGRIINMSSVKGLYSWPGDSIYCVTKHGIETMSDSLRLEMIKFGVKVALIEPGQYGASTSLFAPDQVKRYHEEVDDMWKSASDDVKQTYGRKYFDRIRYKMSNMTKNRKITPTYPVLDAIEDALLNVAPKKRYLVGGSFTLVDKLTVLAKCYSFMPVWLSDKIICYMSDCKSFNGQTKR